MRELWGTGTLGLLMTFAGCGSVTVKHEVEPIYITVDINVRVQQELDDFFDFEDESDAKNEQPSKMQKNNGVLL